MSPTTLTRRDMFRRTVRPEPDLIVVRPPWSDEASIVDACTSCGDCLPACPQSILLKDAEGRPFVDFDRGECTFCHACAEACTEPVFDRSVSHPWTLTVEISSACFLSTGVTCQICTEFCDAEALSFDMSVGPVGAIRINNDACTGCGACRSTCPTQAISISPASGTIAS